MITCTPRAVELLRTADAGARRFNPDARIRLVAEGDGVRFELADGPEPGDAVVDHEAGFTLLVAAGLAGTVDVAEPHDRLVLIADDRPER
jgi:hypothetical protein